MASLRGPRMSKDSAKAEKRGPLPRGWKALMTPVLIRLPHEMMIKIDAQSGARLERRGRSGVIRELLDEACQATAGNTRADE